jgi:hypothetical protein
MSIKVGDVLFAGTITENADDFAPFAEVVTMSVGDAFRAMTAQAVPE